MKINFENARYIKLGEGGCWEEECIANNKIRIGYNLIDASDIQNGEWDKINEIIREDYQSKNKKTGWTNDFNALKAIIDANENTVFITFHVDKLYWTKAKNGTLKEDDVSKYLDTSMPWSCQNIDGTKTFELNQISGRITKLQGFMATTCSVGNNLKELDYLKNLINGVESEEYKNLSKAKSSLHDALIPAIKNLIPNDFEILVDLIFRGIGWKRTSILGETMKFFDLVLEEPMSKKLYGVQVKSHSNKSTFDKYKKDFENYKNEFETLYYFVHTPDKSFENIVNDDEQIKIVMVDEIADFAIDCGLINWLLEKTR